MSIQHLGFSSLLLNIQIQEQPKFTSEVTTITLLNGFMVKPLGPFRASQSAIVDQAGFSGDQSTMVKRENSLLQKLHVSHISINVVTFYLIFGYKISDFCWQNYNNTRHLFSDCVMLSYIKLRNDCIMQSFLKHL